MIGEWLIGSFRFRLVRPGPSDAISLVGRRWASEKHLSDYGASIRHVADSLTTVATVVFKRYGALEHNHEREFCYRSHSGPHSYRCGSCLRRALRPVWEALHLAG